MIDVARLTKLYGDLRAVSDLSFRVAPGEIVGLIGPNGAGKTSTLRCIVGLQAPSAGTITVAGHDIVRDPVEAKRQLAFMADEPQLFEYLTVMEHLRLTARIYGVTRLRPAGGVAARGAGARRQAGLAARRAVARHEAEGRDRLRLIHEPKVLLFDEPLTGLDPLGIRHMKETIVARGRAGAAVIVSSHLLHLVEEICTRIVIIDRGVKVADGTLAELSREPPAPAGSSLEQIFLKVTERDD